MMLASACGYPALPTDETGRGKTEELDEALAFYEVQLPTDASDISYTVHTSIDSHAVGVQFGTTPDGLDQLLTSIGRNQRHLREGMNPWETSSRLSTHAPERFGWDLASIATYVGLEVHSPSSLGATGVLVDLRDPAEPVVYLEALGCC
jgi:hypothetical protein